MKITAIKTANFIGAMAVAFDRLVRRFLRSERIGR